uniref:Uncharacterized protein n=1 Tax=Ranid herpesvirus 4 TaxID=2849006 RepID=A0A8F3CIK5_9VIRU|nr:MAG: hypothetical protein [Ranid herpesvirus 4]
MYYKTGLLLVLILCVSVDARIFFPHNGSPFMINTKTSKTAIACASKIMLHPEFALVYWLLKNETNIYFPEDVSSDIEETPTTVRNMTKGGWEITTPILIHKEAYELVEKYEFICVESTSTGQQRKHIPIQLNKDASTSIS